MTKTMKHAARIVLAAATIFFSQIAAANTFRTDATDLWWDRFAGGWGVNVSHQNDVMVLTFFVYGENNAPVWYSASDVRFVNADPDGSEVYVGALYQSNGPWQGAIFFDTKDVTYRQVGWVTFRLSAAQTATLTYSVDGLSVTKFLARYSFRSNNLEGDYVGAAIGTYSGCSPALDGYKEQPATIRITQDTNTAVMRATANEGGTCTYSGPLGPNGRFSTMSGNVACTSGINGNFIAFEIDANRQGLTARASIFGNDGCQWTGRIGGVRKGQ